MDCNIYDEVTELTEEMMEVLMGKSVRMLAIADEHWPRLRAELNKRAEILPSAADQSEVEE